MEGLLGLFTSHLQKRLFDLYTSKLNPWEVLTPTLPSPLQITSSLLCPMGVCEPNLLAQRKSAGGQAASLVFVSGPSEISTK